MTSKPGKKEEKKKVIAPFFKSTFDAYPNAVENEDEIEEAAKRMKMRNYTSSDSGVQDIKLNTYYCAVCGNLTLVSESAIDKLPVRKTDQAIIIQEEKVSLKHYMTKGEHKIIKRDSAEGYEPQWRWNCICGARIGYQCVPFIQTESAKQAKENNLKVTFSNIPHLYLLSDSLVLSQSDCKVYQTLAQSEKKKEYD